MKPEQLEGIRKRSANSSGNWLADYLKLQNAQIVLTDDVPALIEEIERLKSVINHINNCAEVFFEEGDDGVYSIPEGTPNRDFMREIFVISAEEVDGE